MCIRDSAMSGQTMTKDSLHEAARKLRLLATDQAEQERRLSDVCPELARTAFLDVYKRQAFIAS